MRGCAWGKEKIYQLFVHQPHPQSYSYMKQDEVKKETASDSVLCNLSEAITPNDGSTPEAGSKLG
jgi:hypothetical protein